MGVLDESGTDGAEFSRKVASGMRVAGAIRSLVNASDLQFECTSLAGNISCTVFLCVAMRQCLEGEGEI